MRGEVLLPGMDLDWTGIIFELRAFFYPATCVLADHMVVHPAGVLNIFS